MFEECPVDLPELPYNYYSVMVNSDNIKPEKLKQKMRLNPIHLQGRISLINGKINYVFYFFYNK